MTHRTYAFFTVTALALTMITACNKANAPAATAVAEAPAAAPVPESPTVPEVANPKTTEDSEASDSDNSLGMTSFCEDFSCGDLPIEMDGVRVGELEEYDEGIREAVYLCDRPEGCACGSRVVPCPQGASCKISLFDKYDEEITATCTGLAGKTISKEEYKGRHAWKDFAERRNFKLSIGNGERNLYVVCAHPGCDCNGTTLTQNTICISRNEKYWDNFYDDYCIFRSKHPEFVSDFSYCDIGATDFEAMCLHPDGCACGATTVAMGDICRDGVAQCSEVSSRPGCRCGDENLGSAYSCIQKVHVCSEESCFCHGNYIAEGRACTKSGDSPAPDPIKPSMQNDGAKKWVRDLCKGAKNIKPWDPGEWVTAKFNKDEDDDRDEDEDEYSIALGPTHVLSDSVTVDSILLCTCGTGKRAPGKGYGCAYDQVLLGDGHPDWRDRALSPLGWECLDFAGCQCGDGKCKAGQICAEEDGSYQCKHFSSMEDSCDFHDIPISNKNREDYGCYSNDDAEQGWYCRNPKGCACGKTKCKQWHLCRASGECGSVPLAESRRSDLTYPEVSQVKD